ncbi:two-component system alkaline phosphatase synthesis response regulator PhoP/two-component system response regulator VicR [Paenibacillus shirakamiensis]|uniref:Two-component system alkaline phosphatase synthesis response regulator PhoP/two-component system response regulator VicR n=1 Tax=Paenibacillus shirakamiensis TaxID=1265935 RepID=A0ABS4JE62_9BACL|nr:response regulator transcription factor [Paenibacillus shirakamiensis]MBP2000007.1 two-component system alkaline phosphatase synthesis response regulator PhoP/two-component system response regulator VicR [Paenibacillus shirakamiensis]
MKKILVIDDEVAIRDLIELVLRRENYVVQTAENRKIALNMLDAFQPDLVVLDLMLPDCSGYDLCKEITEKLAVPVIMLSAKNEIIDKVLGLELGAEDYMTKPFDNRELLARIKVILRRIEIRESGKGTEVKSSCIIHEELTFDLESRRVLKNNVPVSLTAKEFKILETLLQRPHKIFTRDELLQIGWGFDFMGDSRSVDMTIMRLRKKLEDNADEPKYVRTIYGFGYQLGGVEA